MNWNTDQEEVFVHDPKSEAKVKSIYAFIARDKDGNEGIVAHGFDSSSNVRPLICSSEKLLPMLKKLALQCKQFSGGKTIHLVRYDKATELEEI